jgi:hypothetical protein
MTFFRKKRIRSFALDAVAWKWKLLIVFDVFVLVMAGTLTRRPGRGESAAIWRTQWSPVSRDNFRFMDGGWIDSGEMTGNGNSTSVDFDVEELHFI